MGCVSSKRAVSTASPAFEFSTSTTINSSGHGCVISRGSSKNSVRNHSGLVEFKDSAARVGVKKDKDDEECRKLRKDGSVGKGSFTLRVGVSRRHVDAEHCAAGWPSWLSEFAGEAIHGWVPLCADSFEKLEKIGQGTYSSVFKAREVESGRMVALKKVHFDNFQPESVRFMAREIAILRWLDHPNVMRLEGLITSRLSCSIYLVFEYMEHDLTGLLSCPDITFTDSQVKCYMKQLLSGVEHCHLRGVMHRDIKASNILVNNEGILKLGDFGLANIFNSKNRQPLTSRVVTLWYRPPELLMGSTRYGPSVDLWSVGCVFAELLLGKPILKGRTEVEQLHKIFKLCGSPPEEYWKKSKLPLATMFKPQNIYESSLQDRCKDFPSSAIKLIETLLSIEPHKRGTASSALMSEYLNSKPFSCDPSSLPKYAPNKEIDAKWREEARRRKAGSKLREAGIARKQRRISKTLLEPKSVNKLASKEEMQDTTDLSRIPKAKGGYDISQATTASQANGLFSGPLITPSSRFAWAKRLKADDTASTMSFLIPSSKSDISALDSSGSLSKSALGIPDKEDGDIPNGVGDKYKMNKQTARTQQNQFDMYKSFHSFHSQDLSAIHQKEELPAPRKNVDPSEFSGPLLSRPFGIDEHLENNERQIRQAARTSRFDGD